MAFEKNLVGRTITKEKWLSDEYGVLVFDNGQAMLLKVELFDNATYIKEVILNRMNALRNQADSFSIFTAP